VISSFFSNGVDGGYYNDNMYGQYGQSYDEGYEYDEQNNYDQPAYNTFGYAPTSSYHEPATYFGYDQ